MQITIIISGSDHRFAETRVVAVTADANPTTMEKVKKAGFDAVLLRGQSETPVYLWVNDGQVEIRDAGAIAELGSRQAEDAIRDELKNIIG